MTVGELIEKLKEFPQDHLAVSPISWGDDTYYFPISTITPIYVSDEASEILVDAAKQDWLDYQGDALEGLDQEVVDKAFYAYMALDATPSVALISVDM